MKNCERVLQKISGTFIIVPFTTFKRAFGKEGKSEKHKQSSTHTVNVQIETLRCQAMKKLIHAQIIQKSESETDLNRKGLKTLFQGSYFLVKGELTHTTKHESLIESILHKLSDDFETRRQAQSDRLNYSSMNTSSKLQVYIWKVLQDELKNTLKNKKSSISADESTSLRNEMELSMMFLAMEDKVPKEKFLAIVKISNGEVKTIVDAIDLNYENIIAFGFDGASNTVGMLKE